MTEAWGRGGLEHAQCWDLVSQREEGSVPPKDQRPPLAPCILFQGPNLSGCCSVRCPLCAFLLSEQLLVPFCLCPSSRLAPGHCSPSIEIVRS